MVERYVIETESKSIFATAFEESHESFATDVVIKAGPQKTELNCHRIVLASSSNFLRSVLSSVTSGTVPVILLPDISASVIELILNYIYYGEVNIPSDKYDEFVAACGTLKIKPAYDTVDENTDESDVNQDKILSEEESNEDCIEEPLNLENQENRNNNSIIKEPSTIIQRKESNKISVTPESSISIQEKLNDAIRRVYKTLHIPISYKIKKRISESKIVVKDGVLLRGVHVCGLCGPTKTFRIGYNMDFAADKVSFKMYRLKMHLKETHSDILGNEENSKKRKRMFLTPELAVLAKEKLVVQVRKVYRKLKIPIGPKTEKLISESRLVVRKDDTLVKGVHQCGLCGELLNLHYLSYHAKRNESITYHTTQLKTHLKDKHANVWEMKLKINKY